MIFGTTFFGVLYGCIIGLVWAFALHIDSLTGLTYGGCLGGGLALFFAINQKITELKFKKEFREMTKTNSNFFFMLLVIGVLSGLITWAIRAIFF